MSEFKLSIPLPTPDICGEWTDSTWHCDLMPSMNNVGKGLLVLVDTEDCLYQKAELGTDGEFHRFFIYNTDGIVIGCSNDLNEVLIFAKVYCA